MEPPKQEQLGYLWDVYKYRHGLCWQAVYKIVAVVIVLAVLPYAKVELIEFLGQWMLVPPIIGTLFAAFGVFVVNNELKLFSYVKVAHHSLEKQFLESVLKDDKVRKKAVDPLDYKNYKKARWTSFDIFVHILMLILFLLSLGNIMFLADSGFLTCR